VGVREPALYKLNNGELLLTFHDEDDVHFARRGFLRSSDNGKTWQEDVPRAHREQAVGGSADGKIIYAPDIYTFEKNQGTYIGSYYISEDSGMTFTGPHETTVCINGVSSTDYPMSAEHLPAEDHPAAKFFVPIPDYYKPYIKQDICRRAFSFWRYIREIDGRWLATMQGKYHQDNSFYRTILVESVDKGKTWNYVSEIAVEYDWGKDGMCEPVLQEVSDGSLLCILRRGGGHQLAQARSLDRGKTWQPFELLPGHGVDPDLCLMSNGVLACTFGRRGLHIMFSEEGTGHSWGYKTEIGSWRSSCYMSIAEIEPGKLLLVYDKVDSDKPGAGRDPDSCYIGATTLTIEKV
jgi:hypothetical protein